MTKEPPFRFYDEIIPAEDDGGGEPLFKCKHEQIIEEVEGLTEEQVCPPDHAKYDKPGYQYFNEAEVMLIKRAQRVLREVPVCPNSGEPLELDCRWLRDGLEVELRLVLQYYCDNCASELGEPPPWAEMEEVHLEPLPPKADALLVADSTLEDHRRRFCRKPLSQTLMQLYLLQRRLALLAQLE